MKIHFDKVSPSTNSFEANADGVALVGELKRVDKHTVSLKGQLSGDLELDCDRCGKSYTKSINNSLELILSERIVKDKEDLDIIEFLDGMIDITYIIDSEVNLIKSSYHYCLECSDEAKEFEFEF